VVTEEQREVAERIAAKNAQDVYTWDQVAAWLIVTLAAVASWVLSYMAAPTTP